MATVQDVAGTSLYYAHLWLIAAIAGGCGVSDAVVESGMPVAGQSGTTATTSAPAAAATAPAAVSGSSDSTAVPSTPAPGASSAAGSTTAGSSAAPVTTPAAGTGMVAAGSGATPAAGTGATAVPSANPSGDCRPAKFTLATRVTLDMSWAETIGLLGGNAKGYFWGKLTLSGSGENITTEYRACGSLTPSYMGTAVTGNIKVFQTVPQAAFDLPSMPTIQGKASKVGGMLKVEPGVLVGGLMMADVNGPWPTNASEPTLMKMDHDSDGHPGVTSVFKYDEGYTGSPTSILQTQRIDRNYGASRFAWDGVATDPNCADTLEGTARVTAYDILILGCHVRDGSDCTPEEAAFLEENRPKWMRGAATWTAKVIPDDSTCAQAREVLAIPGPTITP